jgi:8-oxo-dGTP pyrophosphatase MutT (NUDIX family)
VFLRDGEPGLEVLLLRRGRRAGFAPDTYVFPGGRVDPADAASARVSPIDGLTPEAAATRLSLPKGDPPAIAYYLAALREAFEETGILLGTRGDGSLPPTAAMEPAVDRIRNDLMEGRIGFADALATLECRLSGGAVEYFAHWITPRRQPRRFDARFFAARVHRSSASIVDPREMTEARWISPGRAIDEHARGALPMIRPTVWTLEKLQGFAAAEEALEGLVSEAVVTILPDD